MLSLTCSWLDVMAAMAAASSGTALFSSTIVIVSFFDGCRFDVSVPHTVNEKSGCMDECSGFYVIPVIRE